MKKMYKKIALVLCTVLILSLLTSCGTEKKNDNVTDGDKKTTISIGCMPLNEEAVETLKDMMAEKGYEIKVMVFDGNNLPAEALKANEIDCLILNHLPWINNFNKENNSEITMVDGFAYASYMGIYSAKHSSVDEIPNGGTIIASNDPSNMDRSLRFMEKLGLIKLGEKTGDYYTVLDIVENPKNLKILEVETTNTAGSYQDADAAIAFSSVMKNAGIDAHSYLAEDGEYIKYPCGFFVNKGDETSDWAKALVEVAQTQEYADKFNDIFKGAYNIIDYSK